MSATVVMALVGDATALVWFVFAWNGWLVVLPRPIGYAAGVCCFALSCIWWMSWWRGVPAWWAR